MTDGEFALSFGLFIVGLIAVAWAAGPIVWHVIQVLRGKDRT